MAAVSASNFGQKLIHTDALYFTVTVFTTVGFGDITAKSEGARLLVTAQMIADLIVLGVGAKIILGAGDTRPSAPASQRGCRRNRPVAAQPGAMMGLRRWSVSGFEFHVVLGSGLEDPG
jgi:Ion channel